MVCPLTINGTSSDFATRIDARRLDTGRLATRVGAALAALCLAMSSSTLLDAQSVIRYQLDLQRREHHEAMVQIHYDSLPDQLLELRMSRSSPGRYALHEFAKNVYQVRATDESGRPLKVTRPNPHQWNVEGHSGVVRVSYRIFGDRSDGTYMAVDDTHGHFNIPATFMWARGLEDRPISLAINGAPDDWIVATQLAPSEERRRFTAPNLYYFLDSPIEISALTILDWPVTNGLGDEQTIRLAIHHQGSAAQANAYQEMAIAVVEEQRAVYGEFPEFDYGTYTFIADYLPWVNGDGMEHRNSTVLSSTRDLGDPMGVIGTLSHEFFHAWNVERIRPATLEPFDFERANMSDALWFAEGFTSYYDDLTLKRAALMTLEDYVAAIGSTLSTVANAPGRGFFSPVEMSQQAPFVDAATSVDPTNRSNTFLSYYSYGAVLALGLDLSIREKFPTKSLDDVMRLMWERFGKTERPYRVLEIQGAVADVTDDAGFARNFFDSHIFHGALPDYENLLLRAGLRLRLRRPGKVWLGASLEEDSLSVRGNTVIDAPAYGAGINRGDRLISLGGLPLESIATLRKIMDQAAPAEHTTISFEQRGGISTSELIWKEDPTLEIVTFESLNEEVTETIRRFRALWLESRVEPHQ